MGLSVCEAGHSMAEVEEFSELGGDLVRRGSGVLHPTPGHCPSRTPPYNILHVLHATVLLFLPLTRHLFPRRRVGYEFADR